ATERPGQDREFIRLLLTRSLPGSGPGPFRVNVPTKGGTNRRRITDRTCFPLCSPQHVVVPTAFPQQVHRLSRMMRTGLRSGSLTFGGGSGAHGRGTPRK